MDLEEQDALKKLAAEVPVDLLRAGPERYGPLKPGTAGAWRLISENGIPTALAWTDWKEGFGIFTIRDGEVADRLDNYVITSKAIDIPAGWAYTTLDRFVKRFGTNVELSEPKGGRLSGALRDASGEVGEEANTDGA